jgi:3-keto-5-aminohexanoate cleavage enzyme
MGRNTWDFMSEAISIGNNIRVGTEDCPFDIDGSVATDNTALVRRAVKIVEEKGREIATPQQVEKVISTG